MYNCSRHHMESLHRDKYQALECKDNSLMVLCLISFQSKTRLHMTQMELILQSGSSNACPNHNQAFISMQQRLQSKKPNYISPDSIVSECNRYCYTHEETQNVEVALETRRLYLGNPFHFLDQLQQHFYPRFISMSCTRSNGRHFSQHSPTVWLSMSVNCPVPGYRVSNFGSVTLEKFCKTTKYLYKICLVNNQ